MADPSSSSPSDFLSSRSSGGNDSSLSLSDELFDSEELLVAWTAHRNANYRT